METRLAQLTVIALLLAQSSGASAQCQRFTVEVIQPDSCPLIGPPRAFGADISQNGWVCGTVGNCNGDPRSYYWTPVNGIVQIPTHAGFPDSGATALNDLGDVVGAMHNQAKSIERQAYLFNDNTLFNLGEASGEYTSIATAIRNVNPVLIVGNARSTISSPQRAVLWDEKRSISTIDLTLGPSSDARDINDDADTCGWMGDSALTSHGFVRYNNGTVIDLGLMPQGRSTEASAINNQREVVGFGINFRPKGGTTTRAFYWKDSVMTIIDPLPGFDRSAASDINDDGTVIGACTSLSDATAFLWKNNIILDLHDLFPPESGLTIGTTGLSINNAGQITGTGGFEGQTVAFRLTPVPGKLGDVNCDNLVNVDDLLDLIGQWGPCVGGPDPCHWADLNHDNTINHTDLFITLNNWGK